MRSVVDHDIREHHPIMTVVADNPVHRDVRPRHSTTAHPPELFRPSARVGRGSRWDYRRFATAAEAIRFAVEEFPAVRALGAWMQVGDQRFDGDDIQRLYEGNDHPLQRRPWD